MLTVHTIISGEMWVMFCYNEGYILLEFRLCFVKIEIKKLIQKVTAIRLN